MDLTVSIPSANPTCASWGVLTTSPTAHTPSTAVRWYSSTTTNPRSSTSTPVPGSRSPSVSGRLPTDTTTASTVTDSPSPNDTVVPLCPGAWPVTETPVCTLMPRLRNDRATTLTTSVSHPVSRVGRASSTVTCVPRSENIDANSQPMAPPPITATEDGSDSRSSTSSEVMTTLPSTSKPGMVRGTEPDANTTCRPAISRV